MSAKKFKVGDKVKVRKGLVAGKYYGGMCCDNTMAWMGGAVLTVDCAKSGYYKVEQYNFKWTDEMLEPVDKTLDNLCAGDFVECGGIIVKRVLVAIDGCYLLSSAVNHDTAGYWYTAAELDELGCYPVELANPEPTVEINGKKYKKADAEKAIKDLEVVE